MPEEHPLEQFIPDPEDSVVGSVLISPNHETLNQALAADFIDAVPLGGDALLIVRGDIAERKGIDFPDDQVYVQNAISDLPPPVDYLLEAISMPNTISYVESNEPVTVADGVELQVFEDENLGVRFVLPAIVDTPFGIPDPGDYSPV